MNSQERALAKAKEKIEEMWFIVHLSNTLENRRIDLAVRS